jgi:hypothetical protein
MGVGIDKQIAEATNEIARTKDSRGHLLVPASTLIALHRKLRDLKKQRADNMGRAKK